MCDRFKKSPTATLHNYWTFTSHMFIYLFPSPSLDLSTFGAWLFLARSLYAFQMYNEPNERSFTTDFMHARLLFFLLFVCVDFVVVVVIAEFHYYFFRPINEQTDQSTSQPVRQSLNNKDFMSGILYTHTLWEFYRCEWFCMRPKSLWISVLKAHTHTAFYYILLLLLLLEKNAVHTYIWTK